MSRERTPKGPRTSVWEPTVFYYTLTHTLSMNLPALLCYVMWRPPSPPVCVRGKEEFNPTLSGRSPQSLGAASRDRSLWKVRSKKIRFYIHLLNATALHSGEPVKTVRSMCDQRKQQPVSCRRTSSLLSPAGLRLSVRFVRTPERTFLKICSSVQSLSAEQKVWACLCDIPRESRLSG